MKTLLRSLLALLTIGSASAATITLQFTITTPASTGITCTPIPATLTAPVAPGTTLASCTVAPATWSGAIILSNAQLVVASTGPNTFNLNVGAAALAAGSYTETVTTTP